MKFLSQRTLPIIAASSLLFAGVSSFQSVAHAWTYYVFHDQESAPFTGSTADEAVSKCRAWANNHKKDPNKCGSPIIR